MSYAYGQDGDSRRLWRMAVKSSLLVVAVMIPIAVVGWFLLPPVVAKLFPKYTEGVTAAQLLLVAAVFSGATLGRMAIWSLKAWRLMAWYQVLGAIVVIAGPIIGGFCFARPLVGVSVGLLVGQVVWLPAAWFLIYMATHRPEKSSAKTV
jgi:O-antigen/teichoic acid export membrane protein